MTVSTPQNDQIISRLVALAGGDPHLLVRALKDLNDELAEPPTVEQIVRRVIELRNQVLASQRAEEVLPDDEPRGAR